MASEADKGSSNFVVVMVAGRLSEALKAGVSTPTSLSTFLRDCAREFDIAMSRIGGRVPSTEIGWPLVGYVPIDRIEHLRLRATDFLPLLSIRVDGSEVGMRIGISVAHCNFESEGERITQLLGDDLNRMHETILNHPHNRVVLVSSNLMTCIDTTVGDSNVFVATPSLR